MSQKIIIFDFNRTLYNPETATLFEGVKEVLEEFMSRGFKLILLGKGDEEKRRKVVELGIENYFSEIYLVPEKSLEQLETIKTENKDTEIYSVGDRIKKEIKLGNQLGFKTIWFRNGKFAEEVPEFPEEEPWRIISKITEVGKVISE